MISFGGGFVSLNMQRNLSNTQDRLNTSLRRLSSGLRINSAGDDPAGLAISEKLTSQIRSLSRAEQNAADGLSVAQTASGALGEVSGVLHRMRELATQSANGTLSSSDRTALETEFVELRSEVDRIADVTEFNGTKLLDGSGSLDFFVGINSASSSTITMASGDVHSSQIGSATASLDSLSVNTQSGAAISLGAIDEALDDVSSVQASVGATENRLGVAISNLQSSRENLTAANSRIRDTDVASESALFARNRILMEAGMSVLAQANSVGALALTLLGA
jgi:flagellin